MKASVGFADDIVVFRRGPGVEQLIGVGGACDLSACYFIERKS